MFCAAAALNAPPCAASEPVDLRTFAGLPSVTAGGREAVATRPIGVQVESDLVDVGATVFTRAALRQPLSFALATHPACGDACDDRTSLGHDIALTIKIPRLNAGAPWIDVVVRRWSTQPAFASNASRSSGTTAGITVTQPVGSIDVLLGFSTPVGAPVSQGGWTSEHAGSPTMRLAYVAAARNMRLGVWGTRSLDDRVDPMRLGAGIDFSF